MCNDNEAMMGKDRELKGKVEDSSVPGRRKRRFMN